MTSNKISGKGAYTPMGIKNDTQRFESSVRTCRKASGGSPLPVSLAITHDAYWPDDAIAGAQKRSKA